MKIKTIFVTLLFAVSMWATTPSTTSTQPKAGCCEQHAVCCHDKKEEITKADCCKAGAYCCKGGQAQCCAAIAKSTTGCKGNACQRHGAKA